jgi:ubiquinol-cytochrome c reductase iron-sulfur subunit
MANDHDGTNPRAGTTVEKYGEHNQPGPGTGVVSSDAVQNPGFEPFRARVADLDPKVARAQ